MSSEKATKVVINKRGNQFWRNLFNKWPVLVWVGMVFVAYKLHTSGVKFERMNGVVFGEYEHVAPLETATIDKLLVDINEPVAEGQTIAILDSSIIDDELKALESEIKIDRMERNRRFQQNLTDANVQLLKARAEKASAERELANAKAEEARVMALPDGSAEKLRPNLARISATVAAAEAKGAEFSDEYMASLEETVTKAEGLLKELESIDSDAAIDAQMNLLNARKERMTVKAKNAGVISTVLKRPGDIVKDGDPIVVIVTNKNRRVRGIVIDEYVDTVKIGDKVWISPENKRSDLRAAEVVAVAPVMTAVPDTASASPGRMIFGREIVCKLPLNDLLLPNQRVIIHVEEPGKVDFWSLGTPHRDPNPR